MPRIPLIVALLSVLACTAVAGAQEFAKGTIIDEVKCAADPAESYALYLPPAYSPERQWNVLSRSGFECRRRRHRLECRIP